MANWAALVLLVVLAGACIEPDYGATPFLCGSSKVCPAGYTCVGAVCRRSGALDGPSGGDLDQALPDAGPDMPVDAAQDLSLDAPPDGQGDLTPDGPPDAAPPDAWPPPGVWKSLKSGSFNMGTPGSDPCRESDEEQHQVTLTQGLVMLSTEVTQDMFQDVMGYLPSGLPACGNCPVAQVTWHQAAAYCNTLSQKVGLTQCYACSGSKASTNCSIAGGFTGKQIYACPGYRLPTEAEWEYACRAGSTSQIYTGALDACEGKSSAANVIAWYSDNSGYTPGDGYTAHSVGGKQANAWGLHDMSGNVFEWCHDRYKSSLGTGAVTNPVVFSGADAVSRGGSYGSWPRYLRCGNRGWHAPGDPVNSTGLRCVRSDI